VEVRIFAGSPSALRMRRWRALVRIVAPAMITTNRTTNKASETVAGFMAGAAANSGVSSYGGGLYAGYAVEDEFPTAAAM
jgi:2-iminoacetate synthase ThiH